MKDNNFIKRLFNKSLNHFLKTIWYKSRAHDMWMIKWKEFLEFQKVWVQRISSKTIEIIIFVTDTSVPPRESHEDWI